MNTTPACPCGSGIDFRHCCQPYISGADLPPTAEALMRSRYSAHVRLAVDYLSATVATSQRIHHLPQNIATWASSVEWIRLDIINTDAGSPTDTKGMVEFKAWYRDSKGLQCLHERSRFIREDGHWRYLDGTHGEKDWRTIYGRNDPCPCGSGKKVKKCCG